MFETFDHTADIGLRIRAVDLDSLFADAARGLISLLLDNSASVEPQTSTQIILTASTMEDLLFDWLAELIYNIDAHQLVFRRFDVQVRDLSLRADCWGEKLDPSRHQVIRELKAITYHELSIKRVNGDWQAEVIVDI